MTDDWIWTLDDEQIRRLWADIWGQRKEQEKKHTEAFNSLVRAYRVMRPCFGMTVRRGRSCILLPAENAADAAARLVASLDFFPPGL